MRTVTYKRVLPRDLFNESKLLKVAGKLVCLIEDRVITNMTYEHDTTFTENFIVGQDQSDGAFYLHNLKFYVRFDEGVFELRLHVMQDKEQHWNAYTDCEGFTEPEVRVFDEDGHATQEFLEMLTE